MKEIYLANGKGIALVDDEDFERVSKYNWSINDIKTGYACTRINRKKIFMHRFILNAPKNLDVDHKNHNTLDNRKKNIRLCSTQQNLRYKKKQSNNTSGFKGVYHSKNPKFLNKWHAHITINRKTIHLGCFPTAEKAAEVYNNTAKKYFGEYAQLNHIKGGENVYP